MQFIQVDDPSKAAHALAEKIGGLFEKGCVLWFVCGGSNIPLSVEAMKRIRELVPQTDLRNLTVALTDERYGPIDHADSNWKQLIDARFDIEGVSSIPVLVGKSLEETVSSYTIKLEEALSRNPVVVAQFGIGGDGHIAGVLPHTIGVSDTRMVCAYEATPYERITLTLRAFDNISVAFAFVFGSSKRHVVAQLKDEAVPLADMPSQILKQVPETYLYSDQLK